MLVARQDSARLILADGVCPTIGIRHIKRIDDPAIADQPLGRDLLVILDEDVDVGVGSCPTLWGRGTETLPQASRREANQSGVA